MGCLPPAAPVQPAWDNLLHFGNPVLGTVSLALSLLALYILPGALLSKRKI